MDFLKHHMWLVITLGAMVVLSAVAMTFWYLDNRTWTAQETVLVNTEKKLKATKRFYNREVVTSLTQAQAAREQSLVEIQEYIKQKGKWPVLVEGVFPTYGRESIRVYEFKDKYTTKLRELMKRLNAVDPNPTAGEGGAAGSPSAAGAAPMTLLQDASLFTKLSSFHAAPWLQSGSPQVENVPAMMVQLRDSQNDLYLQEDIVDAIIRTNEVMFNKLAGQANFKKNAANAVIKEIREIRLGADVDTSRGGTGFSGGGQHYRYAAARLDAARADAGSTEVQDRAPTLTGHASNNNGGRYLVLPFRLRVIADAGNYLELVRQLTGTRSFITIENIEVKIVPDEENSLRGAGLLLPSVDTRFFFYGPNPLADVTLTGESLIFEVENGRPTLEPKIQDAAK